MKIPNFFAPINKVFKGLIEFIKSDLEEKKQTKVQGKSITDEFATDMNLETLQKPSKLSHWILWSTCAFFVIALLWAKLAILDEVTRGDGVVIPSRQIQIIQNLEGGIVQELLVREGDIVEKDQILMRLDKTRFSATFEEQRTREISLQLKIARLDAELQNKPFTVNDEIAKQFPTRFEQEKVEYETRINEINRMQQDYDLAQKELNMLRPLLKTGSASKVEVIQQERTANEMKGNILKSKSTALAELNTARSDLAALQEANTANKDRLSRTIVRSPVHGVIKKTNFTTVGGVIGAGNEIMEIVPLDDTLLIEAKVKPQDIGFIHPQQDTMVKISAYDFSIYGGLVGKVEQISADTIKGEKDESYYMIKVRTKKNFLVKNGRELHIMPGMRANVDIMTGQKSVLDYILKPILKTRQNALGER